MHPNDPSRVVGKWAMPLRTIAASLKGRNAIEDFANWRASTEDALSVNHRTGRVEAPGLNEILRFTRRYGPLDIEPSAGAAFSFGAFDWMHRQTSFRNFWSGAYRREHPPDQAHLGPSELARGVAAWFEQQRGSWAGILSPNARPLWPQEDSADMIASDSGRVFYGAATLWRFLLLTLFSADPARLRVCGAPECTSPYFVAAHLNQNFCSTACARWGQRQHQLKWWREHGQEWRAARKPKRKEK